MGGLSSDLPVAPPSRTLIFVNQDQSASAPFLTDVKHRLNLLFPLPFRDGRRQRTPTPPASLRHRVLFPPPLFVEGGM